MKTLSKNAVSGMMFVLGLLPACLCASNGDKTPSLMESESRGSLLAALETARYAAVRVGGTARAGNPAQRLRMDFSREGLRLESTTNDENWSSEWSLKSHGYGMHQMPLRAGGLSVSGSRVEILRAEHGITEWFENRPDGMEHGFTLHSPPQERMDGVPLRLVIGITGDLNARTEGGLDLVLVNREGTDVLRYRKLKVWDADGKILGARMRMGKADELWIEVDDAGACYPVTIDPTFVSETKLLAPDGDAEDEFGVAVAIDGDTAVIGAHRDNVGANADQGSAYVFTGGGTSWTFQQKLTASDGTPQNDFGAAVSIQGDTIFVGAPARSIGPNTQQGKAYVFTRNGTVWTEHQGLVANDGGNLDRFGDSVSLDGDYAIIGASQDTLKGSAYIFVRSDDNWTQQQKIAPADGTDSDDFGKSVSISGGTVVIGAPIGTGAEVKQGAAYVYVRNGSSWSLQGKLTTSGEIGFQQFGYDVALSGDTVLVSKRGTIPIYVFVRNGTTWTEQQKLTPSDNFGNALFSVFRTSVALSGDTAAIGWAGDIRKNTDQGAVFIFERNGTTWTQSQSLIATDGLARDYLGYSVAISGRAVISGAILDDEGTKNSQGSAYIFHQALPDIDLTISHNPTTDQFTLQWNTKPGKWYSIQGSTDLQGYPIDVLAPFDPPADTATHSFPRPGVPKMFYRVKETDLVP